MDIEEEISELREQIESMDKTVERDHLEYFLNTAEECVEDGNVEEARDMVNHVSNRLPTPKNIVKSMDEKHPDLPDIEKKILIVMADCRNIPQSASSIMRMVNRTSIFDGKVSGKEHQSHFDNLIEKNLIEVERNTSERKLQITEKGLETVEGIDGEGVG